MDSSLYAIGDIHGCLDHLKRLLDEIKPDLHRDRLLFIGDYIDRGPDSRGVVDYVIRLKELYPPEHIICLKGNHEAMFLDFLDGREVNLFLFNGGLSTILDYFGEDWRQKQQMVLPIDHHIFYKELRLFYETPDFIFVHGGIAPGVPLTEQQEEDLLWIRGDFITSMEDFGRRVVFGHTPFKRPLMMPNKIGIDTGAVYGNCLTCLKLPEEEFITVGPGGR
jgi:serine/threonine protein phosphatase 1